MTGAKVIVNILRVYWNAFRIYLHQYMLPINILNMHALPSLSSPCGAVLKHIACKHYNFKAFCTEVDEWAGNTALNCGYFYQNGLCIWFMIVSYGRMSEKSPKIFSPSLKWPNNSLDFYRSKVPAFMFTSRDRNINTDRLSGAVW